MSAAACRDPLCRPDDGDEGCMASVCNEGAFDALDFVWIRAWDDCPVMKRHEAAADEAAHRQAQEDEHDARTLRMLEAEGLL